jgi:AcrR family transcriptional regulator
MVKEVKCDKRSLRTRSVIKKAVMVLLKTKRLEEIGVSEIAKIALISRNSFYTHYTSVSGVLDDIFLDIVNRFDDVISKYDYDEFTQNPYPMLKELASPLIDNSAFSEFVVFSKNSIIIVQRIIDTLTDRFYTVYVNKRGEVPNVAFLINFMVSGIIQLIYKWYKDDKPVPLNDILEQVSKIVKEGILMLRDVKNSYINA